MPIANFAAETFLLNDPDRRSDRKISGLGFECNQLCEQAKNTFGVFGVCLRDAIRSVEEPSAHEAFLPRFSDDVQKTGIIRHRY